MSNPSAKSGYLAIKQCMKNCGYAYWKIAFDWETGRTLGKSLSIKKSSRNE